MRQLDVVHLPEGVAAGADVVALVGEVGHGGDLLPVKGEDGPDAVGEGDLKFDAFFRLLFKGFEFC